VIRLRILRNEHASTRAVLMFNAGPIGSYQGDPLYCASLAPAEYETLVSRFGFEVVEHATNDARAGGRTVWLCRRQEES
jgi:hypothetical protein